MDSNERGIDVLSSWFTADNFCLMLVHSSTRYGYTWEDCQSCKQATVTLDDYRVNTRQL